MWRIISDSFAEAWEMTVDVPLPERLKNFMRSDYEQANDATIFVAFPAVGLAVGLIACAVAFALSALIGGVPGAALSGLVVAGMLEMVGNGRCVSAIASCADLVMGGVPPWAAFTKMDDDVRSPKGTFGLMKLVSVFLVRVFCVGFLVHCGAFFWLILAVVFNFTARAQLSVTNDLNTGEQFLNMEDDRFQHGLWIGVGLFTVVVGFSQLAVALLVLVLTYLAVSAARKQCEARLEGMTGLMIDVAGYAVETWTLLIGVVACAKMA